MNYMQDTVNPFDDFQRHRLEAIDLLERCLNENTPLPMERWLQARIVGAGGALQLLSDIQESLHYRLIGRLRAQLDVLSSPEPSLAPHLEGEIAVLTRLHRFVEDWLRALWVTTAQGAWQGKRADFLH
jgi:hypothetical protein